MELNEFTLYCLFFCSNGVKVHNEEVNSIAGIHSSCLADYIIGLVFGHYNNLTIEVAM
jgi:hypothetical protein